MGHSTPPDQSTETVIESRPVVVQQELTPPQTPPAQGNPMQGAAAGTPMSPNPTPSANAAASAVSSQLVSTTELKTRKGKTIVVKQGGGQLFETSNDSDD